MLLYDESYWSEMNAAYLHVTGNHAVNVLNHGYYRHAISMLEHPNCPMLIINHFPILVYSLHSPVTCGTVVVMV